MEPLKFSLYLAGGGAVYVGFLFLVTLALGLRAGGAMGHYLAAEAAPMVILAALLWFGAAASILHWCAALRYHGLAHRLFARCFASVGARSVSRRGWLVSGPCSVAAQRSR